jgi:hypothetical protein
MLLNSEKSIKKINIFIINFDNMLHDVMQFLYNNMEIYTTCKFFLKFRKLNPYLKFTLNKNNGGLNYYYCNEFREKIRSLIYQPQKQLHLCFSNFIEIKDSELYKLSNVYYLDLSYTNIVDISLLKVVGILNLIYCMSISNLDSLGNNNITILNICNCKINDNNINSLNSINTLLAIGCTGNNDFSGLVTIPKLVINAKDYNYYF